MDKGIEHRRSRIARNQVAVIGSVRSPQRKDEDEEEEAEDEDGQGDEEDGEEEEGGGGTRLRFDQLGLRASQLKLPYYRQSITEDDERYLCTIEEHFNTLPEKHEIPQYTLGDNFNNDTFCAVSTGLLAPPLLKRLPHAQCPPIRPVQLPGAATVELFHLL